MKAFTLIGARPQFITLGAVSRLLAGRQGCAELIIHIGQDGQPCGCGQASQAVIDAVLTLGRGH